MPEEAPPSCEGPLKEGPRLLKTWLEAQGARTGLSPVEALRELLTEENQGRRSPRVDAATEVEVVVLPLEKIFLPATAHYKKCEPRVPKAKAGEVVILGVVVEDARGVQVLVDGYHRMKWAQEVRLKEGVFFRLR